MRNNECSVFQLITRGMRGSCTKKIKVLLTKHKTVDKKFITDLFRAAVNKPVSSRTINNVRK